ncbi:MAG TPA: PQQ-binding-like beta-propeller repeat protein [Oligoflexus sp.]|uniref:outer membrane protein assembly factor BamB family protein n=1 Tax=Oligoflexus sp. TaxID=1971216 RepID=UPI002D499FB6|nr:PQQ-binding-like beta-propeller repeat protein [Oligoflexus sp.]HYX35245.1 PQQ-binding-like beta-propeller repeat protein [Oligoflexus sp.]
MQALIVLGLALSFSAFGAVQVEWNAPLADCTPVDLAVDPEGQSYVTCQQPYGEAAVVYRYASNGRLTGTRSLPALDKGSLMPRDLLLHEGILYLSQTLQTDDATHSQLIALEPASLQILWQDEGSHFVGLNLVALPHGGIWWLGVNDARDADILASRYTSSGTRAASFRYDSGVHDSLGFDRRSGAAGPDSSLYIGGFSEVLRVADDGTLLWKKDFPTTAIASRLDGELIATNLRAPLGSTARFDEDGKLIWQVDQGASALTLAPDQTIWMAGTKVVGQTADWDVRLLQLSENGAVQARDDYVGPFQDRAVDIATDAAGNAYVLASSYVKSGWLGTVDRYLILKYDRAGARLWSHLYGAVGLPEALHVTAEGGVYAVGRDGMILLRD